MIAPRDRVVQLIAVRVARISRPHPVRVAIDGVDAAGKTRLADELAHAVERLGRPVIRASIDGFHNPRGIRYQRGKLSPDGYYEDSFNLPAAIEELLRPLGPGGSCQFRRAVFDHHKDQPMSAALETAPSDAVLLMDGVFLLRRELRQWFDFSIFVEADFEITLQRAASRDVGLFGGAEEVSLRYQRRYIPGQQLYLKDAQPDSWASLIVNNNDTSQPSIVSQPRPVNLARTRAIVAISGLPGSGKTTLARGLTRLTDLPLIDKDDILGELFVSQGTGDGGWRRKLSRESDSILQERVVRGDGAILSSFWHSSGMAPDSGTPTGWLGALGRPIVHIWCACPAEIAADRFIRRERHPGHLDAVRTPADVLASLQALEQLAPPALGEALVVDTTHAIDAREVVRSVRDRLGV